MIKIDLSKSIGMRRGDIQFNMGMHFVRMKHDPEYREQTKKAMRRAAKELAKHFKRTRKRIRRINRSL